MPVPSVHRTRLRRLRPILAVAVAAALIGTAAPAGATVTLAASAPAPAIAPSLSQQVIFKAGQDPGYACFRIPAIVKANDGTLLAFAEGRVNGCGDSGDIDTVLKRSTDGGRTWGPLQVVDEGNGDTHGQPGPVVDTRTGRILLITNENPGGTNSAACPIPCDRTAYIQYSDDDGSTWSAARDITSQVKLPSWNEWFVTGPNHALQLTEGPHRGRLVIGINAETGTGTFETANIGALAYSDDGGDTWHIGAVDNVPFAADRTFAQKPSELSLVQLPGGGIYAAGREQSGTDIGNRDYAISNDGGETFSTPFTTIPDLVTPMVLGSTLGLQGEANGGRILFSSPANTDLRKTMMIRSSYDHGRTWENADQGTVISDDQAAYSDMVQITAPDAADTFVGLLYEGGSVTAYDEIRLATFNTEYLGYRNPAGPRTPDLSRPAAFGNVLGGASTGTGVFGKGLVLDGVDDYVRVPYDSSQLPGDGDFTWTAWFNYGATTGNQVIMWLGGMNSTAPQVWLRGEPNNHRLIATMTTQYGTKQIRSASAYNDNAWHFVALERAGDQMLMWVDGVQVAAGPSVAGSVSRTVSFQIQVGERLDGAFHFNGSLDEVRIYNRALDTTELTQVQTTNAALDEGPVVWLPFDRIVPAGD